MSGENPGLELVNSENWFTLGRDRDRLQSEPGWLDAFLGRWGYAKASPVSERERRELLRLRAVLRRVTCAVATDTPIPAVDLAELNGFLASRPARRRLSAIGGGYRLDLEPVQTDWAWTLAEIAVAVADLLAHGERARLKLCQNPDCRWVFYDQGRNRRRRWCDPTICGNRDKVRRFRARQRNA